jgi:hypothetical protein
LHCRLPHPRLRAANYFLYGKPQHRNIGRSFHHHVDWPQPAEPPPHLLLLSLRWPDWQQHIHRHAQYRRCPSRHHQFTCNVVDHLGKQATANTSVTITAPSPPVAPQPRNLCNISFERDKKRPVRVDNEAKGCLDEVALTLNRDTTSKLVIVGKHSADETPDAAAQRDLNVAQYLTQEKGIDPTRIEMRTGGDLTRSLDNILVPAGATFTPGETNTFDSNSVKRQGQPYGKPKTATRAKKPAN